MLDYLGALLRVSIRNERGASAVEYGLLCAGVLAACIVALDVLGMGVRGVFNETNSGLCDDYCSSSPAP